MDGFTGANCQFVQDDNDNGDLAPGYIVLIVLVVIALVVAISVYIYKKSNVCAMPKTSSENTPLSGYKHA